MKTEPTEALKLLSETQLNPIHEIPRYKADIIARIAFSEGQSSPKIKQLEWVEDYGYIKAETPFFKYMVVIIGGKAGLCFDGNNEFLKFKTVAKAKAAAQAHFEKRVKECLDL